MAFVTQSTQQVAPTPTPTGPAGNGTRRRVGDRVFSGLATGSGITILVILAMVAGFLLMQAFPALTTPPSELEAKGYAGFGGDEKAA